MTRLGFCLVFLVYSFTGVFVLTIKKQGNSKSISVIAVGTYILEQMIIVVISEWFCSVGLHQIKWWMGICLCEDQFNRLG